jgi:transcriptional regulator with XRE-family HTH domain
MNRIKFLREERGITTIELGKKIGVTGPAITNYENEKRKIPPKRMQMLADFFDVSLDYLMGRTMVRGSGEDILGLTEVGFHSNEYKAPTLQQKQQIKAIVEAILEKKDEYKNT